jgi:hypothetical protein
MSSSPLQFVNAHTYPHSPIGNGHQIPLAILLELVKDGLAEVHVERLGRPAIEVVHVWISDKGCEALASSSAVLLLKPGNGRGGQGALARPTATSPLRPPLLPRIRPPNNRPG